MKLKLNRALAHVRHQRQQLARLRDDLKRIEKVLDICLGDPWASWLYRHRSERMDPTVPIFARDRAEFHLARYRFAAKFVANQCVVDAACGTGYGSRLLVEEGQAREVVGCDICREAIEYAKVKHLVQKIDFVQADVRQLPMSDSSVDCVVSFETIEHVKDGEQLIAEFARVLKPGGLLIASTPNAWPLSVAPHHVREYNRDSFVALLAPHFSQIELYNQNSGSDFEYNRGQPAGIIPTTDANHHLAECYLALCQ